MSYPTVEAKVRKLIELAQSGGSDDIIKSLVDGSITSLDIPEGATKIESYAFATRWNLASITIPNTVTYIGGYAFFNCSALRELVLPSSLQGISFCAVENSGVKSIRFNSTPSYIESSTFQQAYSLTDIYVPWSYGEVEFAPWGATRATIHYNYTGE